ncbi:hypothetical protein ACFWUZ_35465 [Streptomyces sp. NPDC058646]
MLPAAGAGGAGAPRP